MISPQSSMFSVLSDDLAEKLRLTRQQQREPDLQVLLFSWRQYTLALPMVAAQRVIPISPALQLQMITNLTLDWQGVEIQLVTLPVVNGDTFNPQFQEEESFILSFAVADGRILGLPIVSMPNVIEIPLNWFSGLDTANPQDQGFPFDQWVRFVAQPEMDSVEKTGLPRIYLLDLDLVRLQHPPLREITKGDPIEIEEIF